MYILVEGNFKYLGHRIPEQKILNLKRNLCIISAVPITNIELYVDYNIITDDVLLEVIYAHQLYIM